MAGPGRHHAGLGDRPGSPRGQVDGTLTGGTPVTDVNARGGTSCTVRRAGLPPGGARMRLPLARALPHSWAICAARSRMRPRRETAPIRQGDVIRASQMLLRSVISPRRGLERPYPPFCKSTAARCRAGPLCRNRLICGASAGAKVTASRRRCPALCRWLPTWGMSEQISWWLCGLAARGGG